MSRGWIVDSIQVSRLESTKVKRKWRANRTGMGWRTHGPEQVLESGEHTDLSRAGATEHTDVVRSGRWKAQR